MILKYVFLGLTNLGYNSKYALIINKLCVLLFPIHLLIKLYIIYIFIHI